MTSWVSDFLAVDERPAAARALRCAGSRTSLQRRGGQCGKRAKKWSRTLQKVDDSQGGAGRTWRAAPCRSLARNRTRSLPQTEHSFSTRLVLLAHSFSTESTVVGGMIGGRGGEGVAPGRPMSAATLSAMHFENTPNTDDPAHRVQFKNSQKCEAVPRRARILGS